MWNAVTSPLLNYHFVGDSPLAVNKNVVPYLGGFVGAVWNDEDFTGTVGPQAGVKLYVTPSTFVAANYRYEWFFDEVGDANDTQDANHVVTVGLGYNWS